ncbi:MAG: murein biosynthesis integral membrane protein MurJ [Planctomycetes bacterium]|nr:murein biosynthesis integral membrane protein MurJ [Planctomycetota bacterium]
MTGSTDSHSERRHFFAAAKLIAAITVASRVGGLVRDMLLSRFFGASGLTSFFWTAWSIPNFFRRLFGEGALSAAFVPVFSETLERNGRPAAAALLANVLALLALLLSVLCVLIEIGLLAAYLRDPEAQGAIILRFIAIVMPFMVTICLVALGSAALNCVGHFAYPAAAPILLNVVTIAMALVAWGLFDDPATQLTVLAWSMPLTGAVQAAGLIWVLRAHNLPYFPKLRPLQPGVKRILLSMAPMMIPLGILQINALVDKFVALLFSGAVGDGITLMGRTLARPLEAGAVTWMNYGERLYQFPMGVLAISLATAVFPLFSRYKARDDMANLRLSVNQAIRLAIFEGLPSGVWLMVLAGPLVALLFGGGDYGAEDVRQTAHVVWFYGLGMWAFCSQHIVLRAFYALDDRRTPLTVACSLVAVNFLLNLVLIWIPAVRHGAFGLSSSITQGLNMAILTLILRRRLGPGVLKDLLPSVVRTAIAAAVMALAVHGARVALTACGLGRPLWVVLGAVAAGVAAFAATSCLLRAPEVGELLGLRRSARGLPVQLKS